MRNKKQIILLIIIALVFVSVSLYIHNSDNQEKDNDVSVTVVKEKIEENIVKKIKLDNNTFLEETRKGDIVIGEDNFEKKLFSLKNSKFYSPNLIDAFIYKTITNKQYYIVINKFSESEYDFRIFNDKYESMTETLAKDLLYFYDNEKVVKENIIAFLKKLEKEGKL